MTELTHLGEDLRREELYDGTPLHHYADVAGGGCATPMSGGRLSRDEAVLARWPSDLALLVQQHLSVPRLRTYVPACGGNLNRAVEFYRSNFEVAGSLWVALGHAEIVLRKALHDVLAVRHARLGRSGLWLDDLVQEMQQQARDDISKAKRRLQQAGARNCLARSWQNCSSASGGSCWPGATRRACGRRCGRRSRRARIRALSC